MDDLQQIQNKGWTGTDDLLTRVEVKEKMEGFPWRNRVHANTEIRHHISLQKKRKGNTQRGSASSCVLKAH